MSAPSPHPAPEAPCRPGAPLHRQRGWASAAEAELRPAGVRAPAETAAMAAMAAPSRTAVPLAWLLALLGAGGVLMAGAVALALLPWLASPAGAGR